MVPEQPNEREPIDREELLVRLAEKIRNGEYEVDVDAVASAVIEYLRKETDVQK